MKPFLNWLQMKLISLGIVVLVIVGLVVLLPLAVAARPLLIVGFLVALAGGALLSHFHPGFRRWFESIGEPQVRYNGLRLATDVALYPSHSWARLMPGNVAVGADDLVQVALGPVDSVELPPVGSHVKQGDRLFGLGSGNRNVEMRAPVSGTVVGTNETLLSSPGLVNDQPFTEGWAVRLRADNVQEDRRQLLQGHRAKGWFRHEIDRLLATVLSAEAAAPALPDGGTLVGDLHQHIDENAWKRLSDTLFGDRPKP